VWERFSDSRLAHTMSVSERRAPVGVVDGRVALRPDSSVKAVLSRHSVSELSPEEFDRHFGELPTDGEG